VSRASWIRDPVTTKELSGLARGWQPYAARTVYVGLFGLLLWYQVDAMSSGERMWLSTSTLTNVGRNALKAFLPLQTALIMLASISSASDLVTKEVRSGTLGLLVCTPLSAWRVAFGKWRAALAQSLVLLLCGIPILGVCASVGAITPGAMVCVFALSAAGAALGSSVALLCSSLFRAGTTAFLTSVVAVGGYLFLPMLVFAHSQPNSPEFIVGAHLHLVFALAGGIAIPTLPDLEMTWLPCSIVTLGLALLLVRMTAVRLAVLSIRPPGVPFVTRLFAALDRFYEGIGPERIRKLRFFVGPAGVPENGAILWKELRTRASGRLRNSVRIALVLLLVLAFCLNLDLRYLWIPAFSSTLLLWLQALANGASLFVKEKEERKWDILLATPLRSGQILSAKLLAGLVPVLPMAGSIAFFWLMQIGAGILNMTFLLLLLSSVALPAILTYMVGAACSLKAHTLRGAFLLALGLMIGLFGLLPWILSEMTRTPLNRYGYYEVTHYPLNPLRYLDAICEAGHQFGRSYSYSYGYGYGYHSNGLREDSAMMTGAYVVLSVALLVYMRTRFHRITGRSE
jgi:ABC-type transport system involved in multi-copper enzyme maturation permease subunit